jgi:hypothetical protein
VTVKTLGQKTTNNRRPGPLDNTSITCRRALGISSFCRQNNKQGPRVFHCTLRRGGPDSCHAMQIKTSQLVMARLHSLREGHYGGDHVDFKAMYRMDSSYPSLLDCNWH